MLKNKNIVLENSNSQIIRKANIDMSNKIIDYHNEYNIEQEKIEKKFKYSDLEKITLNIWDDFWDDGFIPEGEIQETYAYIEHRNIPDIECFKLLYQFMNYLIDNNLLDDDVSVKIEFYDSMSKYPILVNESSYALFKRWELRFKNITHSNIDRLINSVKIKSETGNVDFSIISES